MRLIRETVTNKEENKLYWRALIFTILGNVLLVIIKGIASHLSSSVALYADALNSASDVFYSLFMVVGLLIAIRPPDLSHPQGHSRFEPLVGILIATSMFFAGFQAASASIGRFQTGGAVIEPGLPTVVLFTSAALKAGMFFYISKIAVQLSSPALKVTATDNLSDVLTSLAAFAGIIGSKYIHPLSDPIAGILVAAWIFRAVFLAVRENISYLTGGGAGSDLRQKIIQTAENVPGVLSVHHLMTEYAGPKLVVDMHINVLGDMPLTETHEINDAVTEKLEAMPEVDRAYIHLEPHDWEDK